MARLTLLLTLLALALPAAALAQSPEEAALATERYYQSYGANPAPVVTAAPGGPGGVRARRPVVARGGRHRRRPRPARRRARRLRRPHGAPARHRRLNDDRRGRREPAPPRSYEADAGAAASGGCCAGPREAADAERDEDERDHARARSPGSAATSRGRG